MIDGAPSCGGQAASYGGQAGAGQIDEDIITYLGNLSIANYKWFGCCGIADGKVETRNVKVETGRAERGKLRTLCKTNPQRVRHPAVPNTICLSKMLYPSLYFLTSLFHFSQSFNTIPRVTAPKDRTAAPAMVSAWIGFLPGLPS